MKRRRFLQGAGLTAAVTAIAKPAVAQSMPELRWRLTSSYPKSLDTIYGASEVSSREIAVYVSFPPDYNHRSRSPGSAARCLALMRT
jgi:TRAP-type mannitol/chloroaromatic compound transport system substrate-binding protein